MFGKDGSNRAGYYAGEVDAVFQSELVVDFPDPGGTGGEDQVGCEGVDVVEQEDGADVREVSEALQDVRGRERWERCRSRCW